MPRDGEIGDEEVQIIGDHVIADITYALTENVESLTLADGVGDINGTGNTENNVIQGNSGNNTLSGLSGRDLLAGGNGNDTLIGGEGDDELDGESGSDIAVYTGNYSDYSIVESGDGFIVWDLREFVACRHELRRSIFPYGHLFQTLPRMRRSFRLQILDRSTGWD